MSKGEVVKRAASPFSRGGGAGRRRRRSRRPCGGGSGRPGRGLRGCGGTFAGPRCSACDTAARPRDCRESRSPSPCGRPSSSGQLGGVLRAVVDAGQQHVFERQLPAGEVEIVVGLGQDVGERNFLRRPARSGGGARRSARGAKRPGGSGRRRRPAGASALGRPTVEIVIRRALMPRPSSRLASSSAGKRASRFASGSPMPITTMWLSRSSGPKQPLQPQHLLDDLAGGEIALEAVEAAGAEDAAHAAADLRADADRAADFVAQAARTRSARRRRARAAVFRCRRRPACAARSCVVHSVKSAASSFAQRLRQIGHLLEIGRPAARTANAESAPARYAPWPCSRSHGGKRRRRWRSGGEARDARSSCLPGEHSQILHDRSLTLTPCLGRVRRAIAGQPRPQIVGPRSRQIEPRGRIRSVTARRTAARAPSNSPTNVGRLLVFDAAHARPWNTLANSAARLIASSMNPILSTRPRSRACLAVKIWPVATASSAGRIVLEFRPAAGDDLLESGEAVVDQRLQQSCAPRRSSAGSGCPSA